MRTYARVRNADGTKKWIVISTSPTGDNSMCWLVTLCQVLLLNRNESPFFADYGIAAEQSVQTQTAPDYDIARTQRQFAPYFASLVIARANTNPPTYNITVITLQGTVINFSLPITAAPPNQIPY